MGLGRSYGDAALPAVGGVALECTRLDRLLAFHPEDGVLIAEAGVSLAEIERVFLPRGWFPPVVPGTGHVTLGGAVAADVHGKNHHVDGSIGDHVSELTLALADGRVVTCTPDVDGALFHATIGGMGLTGVILAVGLRLIRVPSAWVTSDVVRTRDLDETIRAFEDDAVHRYSVAWLDVLGRGRRLGRAVIFRGDFAEGREVAKWPAHQRFAMPQGMRVTVPCAAPSAVFRPGLLRWFNAEYWAAHRSKRGALVHAIPFFHPLDAPLRWNRAYGRRGFVQWQALFPEATAREALIRAVSTYRRARGGSFLAVLKRFGREAASRPLSFPRPGWTLTLDLPCDASGSFRVVTKELDAIVAEAGGRFYLAKDALVDSQLFAQGYPRLEAFRQVRQRVDPGRRFRTAQSVRLLGDTDG